MGFVKKAVKKVTKAVGKVFKGAGKAVGTLLGGGAQPAAQITYNAPETQVPAQQLAREAEVAPEDIVLGSDTSDTTSKAKGKRGLVRPVASSLGI